MVNMMSLSMRFSDQVRYLGKACATDGHLARCTMPTRAACGAAASPAGTRALSRRAAALFATWACTCSTRLVAAGHAQAGERARRRGRQVRPARPGLLGLSPACQSRIRRQYAADDLWRRLYPLRERHRPADRESSGPATRRKGPGSSSSAPRRAPSSTAHALQDRQRRAAGYQSSRCTRSPTAWDNIAAHFIACILDGMPCEAPLRHGLIVQQMMEGLLRSAKLGKEVRLDVVM